MTHSTSTSRARPRRHAGRSTAPSPRRSRPSTTPSPRSSTPASLRITAAISPSRSSAPYGSVLNPKPPAPVVGRNVLTHRVATVVMAALGEAAPERARSRRTTATRTSTCSPRSTTTGARTCSSRSRSAAGAADRASTVRTVSPPAIHNLANNPIELVENEFPLRMIRYALRQDSGGAGTLPRRARGRAHVRAARRLRALDAVRPGQVPAARAPRGRSGRAGADPRRARRRGHRASRQVERCAVAARRPRDRAHAGRRWARTGVRAGRRTRSHGTSRAGRSRPRRRAPRTDSRRGCGGRVTGDWYVGVDIGGTFTDVVAVDGASGTLHHLKVPSSRSDPASGFLHGLEALRDEVGAQSEDVRLLLHGTTLATNAIIERRLPTTALVTTEGFRDVLEIARHWRNELYDPFLEQQPALVPRELRLEIRERVGADGTELEPVDLASADAALATLDDADVESVAVAFLHSYRNPDHEQQIAAMLRAHDGWFVCASAELSRRAPRVRAHRDHGSQRRTDAAGRHVSDATRVGSRRRRLYRVALRHAVERGRAHSRRGQIAPRHARAVRPRGRRGRLHPAGADDGPRRPRLLRHGWNERGRLGDRRLRAAHEHRADDRRDPDPPPGDRRATRSEPAEGRSRRSTRAARSGSGPRAPARNPGPPATAAEARRRR